MAEQRIEAAILAVLIPRWLAMLASTAVCDDGIMTSRVSVFRWLDILGVLELRQYVIVVFCQLKFTTDALHSAFDLVFCRCLILHDCTGIENMEGAHHEQGHPWKEVKDLAQDH